MFSGISPAVIISDFEREEIQAVREVFPTTHRKGCMFHFVQAIQRRHKKMSLPLRSRVSVFAAFIIWLGSGLCIRRSRCLGGVEAYYSTLQFDHRNQELLGLYGIYMDLQPHISGRNMEPPRVC